MNYADKETDKAQRALERRMRAMYKEAWKEVADICNDYFDGFAARDYQMLEDLKAGKVRIPNGYTTESYYRQWRLNQIGRGKRWEKVRDEMARRMVNADKVACAYINDTTPGIFSLQHNYSAYQMEQEISLGYFGEKEAEAGVSFTLMNEQAVKRLMTKNVRLFPEPSIDVPKDMAWNKKKLQASLTSSILLGLSIDKVAKKFQDVTDMDERAAVRNARTAVNGAMNAGKQAAMEQAVNKYGIRYQKEWMSALDNRVRASHEHLNGVRVFVDEAFPNGLDHPVDAFGPPAEVYNCRCRMRRIIPGLNDKDIRTDNTADSYKKWIDGKEDNHTASNSKNTDNSLKDSNNRDILRISTGNTRNEEPLTKEQINECIDYAVYLGMDRDLIAYSEEYYTGYNPSFGILLIGTDAYPSDKADNTNRANSMISYKGSIAHEIIGHKQTIERKTAYPAKDVMDEAQASIRAAKFASGLSKQERYWLIRDGYERLRDNGIKLADVKNDFDIWEG